ncbi:glycosyltransferase family 4 protein [Candidatus Parcubacteria bacterium]|nr:glycosyltransferase family 4 protein [Candidatus Parcubacteria bacterium]
MKKEKKAIKILVLSHISVLVGGAEKSLLDVFDLWAKDYSIEPEFILHKPVGSLGAALKKRGWKYHELDYTFWSVDDPPKSNEDIYNHALKNTKTISDIEKIIESSKSDVVLTNSVVCPWAALAAYYQNVPHVWFVREYGDLDHGRIYEIGRVKTLQDVGNLSNLVATNSQALAKYLSGYIDEKKIQVVYNPFDIEKLTKLSEAKVANPYKDQNSLKIAATGTLTVSKGQLEIVKAAAKLNKKGINAELCLIGSNGPREYKQEIQKVIADNNLHDKVHLVGHQKNPLAYVAKADVGVTASRMEAFGRVTFEYMAIGKPVIGTNTGGTTEMIDEGENGYLYSPGDIGTLAKCIGNYVNNPELVEVHGEKSKIKAGEMMGSEHNAENLFRNIEAIVNSKDQIKSSRPINFTHRLIEYLLITDDYLKETDSTTIKTLFKKRLKDRTRTVYKRARHKAGRVIKR